MVGRADRRVTGHLDFVLFDQGRRSFHVHGVSFDHDEAVVWDAFGKLLGEDGVAVGANDPVDAVVFVEFLGDDGSHPAHSDHHCVGHNMCRRNVRFSAPPAGFKLPAPPQAAR